MQARLKVNGGGRVNIDPRLLYKKFHSSCLAPFVQSLRGRMLSTCAQPICYCCDVKVLYHFSKLIFAKKNTRSFSRNVYVYTRTKHEIG